MNMHNPTSTGVSKRTPIESRLRRASRPRRRHSSSDVGAKKHPGEALSAGRSEPDVSVGIRIRRRPMSRTLPDLQNGSASQIKGSKSEIQHVGISNFRLPIRFHTRSGGDIQLETSVTGSVSLEANKRGINMSRIMRSFYKHAEESFSFEVIGGVFESYLGDLESYDARIQMRLSYPMLRRSPPQRARGLPVLQRGARDAADRRDQAADPAHGLRLLLDLPVLAGTRRNMRDGPAARSRRRTPRGRWRGCPSSWSVTRRSGSRTWSTFATAPSRPRPR